MRELKFRAWEAGKMHYNGFVIHADGATEYPQGGWDCSGHDDKINIMQNTGLKDINGKDIYEGDILRDGKGGDGVVKWSNVLAGFIVFADNELCYINEGNPDNTTRLTYTEIIGNIHENPELLEAK